MAELTINDVNPLITAADNHNIGASGFSVFDEVGDFVTQMAPAATVSGLYGVLNTPIEIANWLGAEIEPFNTETTLRSLDDDLANYYVQNKEYADMFGFVGTSLLTGVAAVKAIKFAQAGNLGKGLATAYNLVPQAKEKALSAAIAQIGQDGTTLFSSVTAKKLQALAFGFGENAISSLTAEGIAAAVSAASPVFDGKEFDDILWTIGQGTVFGAAIGGTLDGILLNSQYRKGIKALEAFKRPLESVEAPGLSMMVEGDKISLIINSLMDIPEELATTNALRQTFDATQRRSTQKAIQMANAMAGDDSVIGNSFMELVIKVRDKHLSEGMSVDQTKEKLGELLLNARSMRRLNEFDAEDLLNPKRYLYPPKKFDDIAPDTTLESWINKLFPQEKPSSDAKGYLFSKDVGELKIGITAPSMEATNGFVDGAKKGYFVGQAEAFHEGADVFVDMRKKTVVVNPASANRLVTPGDTGETIVNLKTGQVVLQADRTVGDLAASQKDLYLVGSKREVAVAYKEEGKTVVDTFDQSLPLSWKEASTLDTSARYAWVSLLDQDELLKQVKGVIHSDDLPILEALLQDAKLFDTFNKLGVKVQFADDLMPLSEVAKNSKQLENYIGDLKLQIAKQIREADPKTTNYILAQKLNTSQEFLETGKGTITNPLKDVLSPSHAVVKYQTELPEVDGMFVRGLVGLKQRQGIAKRIQDQAFANAAGDRYEAFPDLDAKTVRDTASQLGSGGGFFTSSSPDYGDVVGTVTQMVGKEAKKWEEVEYQLSAEAFSEAAKRVQQQPKAAAEIGIILEKLRSSANQYTLIGNEVVDKQLAMLEARLASANTASRQLAAKEALNERTQYLLSRGLTPRFVMQYEETVATFQSHIDRNAARLDKLNPLLAANGMSRQFDPSVLYPPPIDTSKYNYIAFVREKGQTVGATNHVGVLVAKSDHELQTLASKVDANQFEVLFKEADIKAFHKAKGDYQYELSLHENRVNSYLERQGLLFSYYPKTEPQAVLDDLFNWHYAQDKRLVTTAVETKYAQPFAELRALGEQYEAIGTSRAAGLGEKFKSKVENPFQDYIRTATNVSKKSNYTLWQDANDFVEGLGQKAYKAIKDVFASAKDQKVSWEEANRIAESHGLASPFKSVHDYLVANTSADKPVMSLATAKANSLLSTVTLRLDWMNSINNVIASPINLGGELSSIRKMVANDDVLAGALRDLREVKIPGMPGVGVPSTSKLIGNSIKNYFGPEGKALIERYTERGFILTDLKMHHQMLDELVVQPGQVASKFSEAVDRAVEIGSKISLNQQAEQFTRFVAADIMRQLTDPLVAAGKMQGKLQNAYINTFVNRVQGNYIASQRPVLFQGVIGQAIGLFQTYQFNLLQNLFRYIGNGDKKTAAIMMGLQGSIYGLQGLPFFDAVNKTLIGNSGMNPYHKDVYSETPQIVGKELGEWILYGTASAFPLFSDDSPAIYSRGDINPRHWSIVPLSPLDAPFISASIRFAQNLVNTAQKMGAGGAALPTILEGLEHNGLSRPLTGIAQVVQGYATTSKGSLISSSLDYAGISEFTRIAGAKPATEAIALDGMYRMTAYKAKDRDRMEILGEAVKTRLRKGESPSDTEMETFMTKYAEAGGNIKNFNSSLTRWYKGANQSQINALRNQLGSEYSRRMMELMGGEDSAPIQDFMNTPSSLESPSGSTE